MIFQSILKRIAASVLIGFSAPALAQTVEFSLDQGRAAARQAVLAGHFEVARDFALALRKADADDRTALVVLAAVQPQLGEARDGRRAGARAFRLSDTGDQRYEAARLTALAAANEERYTLAQFWLRRAAVNAPDDRAFAQTQRDYRGVRNLNPWSVNLGFSITPSNNVNGGSEDEFNIIDGVDFEDETPVLGVFDGAARALPGTVVVADVRLSYAVSRTAQSRTTLTGRAYGRSVWLNGEGQDIAPDSSNADFGTQQLEFSVDHVRNLGEGALSAQALVGALWFGGNLNRDYLRGRLGYSRALNERNSVMVSGQLDAIDLDSSVDPRINHARTVTGSFIHRTQGGNRISGTLSFTGQSSDQVNERFESLTSQVSYSWADPIGPVQLSVSAGIMRAEYRDFSLLVEVPGGRTDTRLFGSVTAVFPEIDYAGFVPVTTLGIQDTESNVSRFQRNEISFNIGVRSSF